MTSSGGFISGEVKLGITLRMLAGGSALDLAILFDVSESHVQKIFLSVLKDWVICSNIGNIDIESYLKNDEAMKKVAIGFSRRSNGIPRGAIGDIDGWLVRIARPYESRDDVANPATFYSRNGVYALNV